MPKYEIKKDVLDNEVLVRSNDDGSESWIPMDEANADYQAYLNKDKPVEHFTPMVTDAPKS
jgi:hypothetical protein